MRCCSAKISCKATINDRFYGINGTVSDTEVSYWISSIITKFVTTGISRRVQSLLSTLKLFCHTASIETKPDEIHLLNGTLYTNGSFSFEKKICIHRLNVTYCPELYSGVYYPEKFLTFLTQLLEPEDILTLQEFMGYCLIPSTKGQAMLFIIGNGGEGKSRIGKVMHHIWGNALLTGKFQQIEHDRFFRYNLIDKLIMLDDDMEMDALKNTGILKSLVTAEIPMDVEAKGNQSEQANLYARIMGFGNGTPKALYDKSDGYARRLLILTTKPKPENRINDSDIAEKFISEKEKILLWMFEGLQRLIANHWQFTKSQRTCLNIAEAVSDNCNFVDFLSDKECITFGAEYQISCTDLYGIYLVWCNRNAITALKRETFINWLKNNEKQYNIKYVFHIQRGDGSHVRGFKGLKAKHSNRIEC